MDINLQKQLSTTHYVTVRICALFFLQSFHTIYIQAHKIIKPPREIKTIPQTGMVPFVSEVDSTKQINKVPVAFLVEIMDVQSSVHWIVKFNY